MHNNQPISWHGAIQGIFHLDYGLALANTLMEGDTVYRLMQAIHLAKLDRRQADFVPGTYGNLPNQTMSLATLACLIGKVPADILVVYCNKETPMTFWVRLNRHFFLSAQVNRPEARGHCKVHLAGEGGEIFREFPSTEELTRRLNLRPDKPLPPTQAEILRLVCEVGRIQLDIPALTETA